MDTIYLSTLIMAIVFSSIKITVNTKTDKMKSISLSAIKYRERYLRNTIYPQGNEGGLFLPNSRLPKVIQERQQNDNAM